MAQLVFNHLQRGSLRQQLINRKRVPEPVRMYSFKLLGKRIPFNGLANVFRSGFENMAALKYLEGSCSIQLSYAGNG
jgi:hypothetical protein